MNEAPIGWNSKGQGSVTLSSTEAEYVSMSEGMKDLLFIKMCLNYIKMKINLPMIVLIDNIGAIEMLDSKTGQCKTKHIDTRYHWIKQYVDKDKVRVNYIKSEENVADILTKNLNPKLFEKHANKLVTNIGNASEQVSDVGFFARCDKVKFPRRKPRRWSSKFRDIRRKIWPGHIEQMEVWPPHQYYPDGEMWRELYYYGNRHRLETYVMKKKQGPRREDTYENHLANIFDESGEFVVPDNTKKRIIWEVRAPHGELIKIYDTDGCVSLGRVKDDYRMDTDLEKMSEIVLNTKDSKKRNAAFIDDLYKIDERITRFQKLEYVDRV